MGLASQETVSSTDAIVVQEPIKLLLIPPQTVALLLTSLLIGQNLFQNKSVPDSIISGTNSSIFVPDMLGVP